MVKGYNLFSDLARSSCRSLIIFEGAHIYGESVFFYSEFPLVSNSLNSVYPSFLYFESHFSGS